MTDAPPPRRHGPGPRGPGEKPQHFREAWRKLLRYMHSYRAPLIGAVILAFVSTALTLIGPNKLQDVTDLVMTGIRSGSMDLGQIQSIALLLLVIYLISAGLSVLQNYILATISQKTAGRLRKDVSAKVDRVPLSYYDRTNSGDIVSRVTNDIDTIGQSMNQSIGTMVTAVTLLVGSLLMMALTNVTMMGTAVLASLFGFGLMFVIMGRSQKYFNQQQKGLGAMNGLVSEVYGGHSVVRAYNGERKAKAEFDRINRDLFRSAFRSQFLAGLMPSLMNFIGNFGYVAVCVVGAMLTIDGQISFGTIVAFMIYVRLFTQPLSQIGQAISSMQSVAAASERVFGFLAAPEMADEAGKQPSDRVATGEVEFRDARFSYVPGTEIIHGFSAQVHAGQKIAIVGPTGAGKTTLVNLLMRFYETDSGEILLDGVPTKEMRRADVHRQFGMVLQDTWLFQGTVRDNIAYCKAGVTDEQIIAACQAVGLHHFIMTLPHGYDTVLNDSSSLSVGQRQQLTIARAMVQNAPLMILDEATSSVDTRTERLIQDAMDRLTAHRTSFVIAHRLSTIKNADLILVVQSGNIVEQGTHEQLLAQHGFYSQLYNSQFENCD